MAASHAASPIVKAGKMMWKLTTKANWMRDSRTGSSAIANAPLGERSRSNSPSPAPREREGPDPKGWEGEGRAAAARHLTPGPRRQGPKTDIPHRLHPAIAASG